MKKAFVLFSIAVTLAVIVTIIAGALWFLAIIRHKENAADIGRAFKIAAIVAVVCFAANGITYALGGAPEPKQQDATPPAAVEPAQEPTQEPVRTPQNTAEPEDEPETTEPADPLQEEPEEAQEETSIINPLLSVEVQTCPVMNGTKTERIGTWAYITTTKDFMEAVTSEQLHQFLSDLKAEEYNWFNVFFEDGTGLWTITPYSIEYGIADTEEGGAVMPGDDLAVRYFNFEGDTYIESIED